MQIDTDVSVLQTFYFEVIYYDRCANSYLKDYFYIEFIENPCLTTAWDDSSLILIPANLTYIASSTSIAKITIMNKTKDIASTIYGNQDGYSFCGERTVHLTDINEQEIYLYDLNGEITLKADIFYFDLMTEGNFTYFLQYSLNLFPFAPRSPPKSISINYKIPCLSLTIENFTITPISIEYEIYQSEILSLNVTTPTDSISLNYGDNFCGLK